MHKIIVNWTGKLLKLVKITKSKSQLEDWEERLISQINTLDILSVSNVVFTSIVLNIIGFDFLNTSLLISGVLGVIVYILNRVGAYLFALYIFYSIGIYLIGSATYYMEIRTNVFMYFFPISLSIVLVIGKNKLLKHMIVWYGIYLISIILLFLYASSRQHVTFDKEVTETLSFFNSIFSFALSITLVVFININNLKRENELQKALNEKQLLLAELFHRVKNNLNVVTSILSLKANSAESEEVRMALDECKSRVYSMALVHQQVYAKNDAGVLNMRSYLSELIRNIQHTMGSTAEVEMNLEQEDVDLPITKAIPIGLIINELLTNSYKHASTRNNNLKITVNLIVKDEQLEFEVKDNGLGFDLDDAKKNGSLGLDIVLALCEQIDAEFGQNKTVPTTCLGLKVCY